MFSVTPHGFEANNLQARVGGSMQGGEDLRSSVSRSASHVSDASEGKGSARDGHYVVVGPHDFANDVSLHTCDASESSHGG